MGGRTPGMKYYNARGQWDKPNGMAFYGTEATIFADRIGWEVFPETGRHAGNVQRSWENEAEPTRLHALNFIESVRSRKKPNADIEIGHRSTSVALLGNIAMKTGRKLHWDADAEDCKDDPEASAMLTRTLREPWDLIQL
jgi:hypothetical protein